MKLRTFLSGAVLGAGALAAYNDRVSDQPFPTPLDHEMATWKWRGFDIAYTELGDPNDPTLLLFHGINAAGSSHEFRYVADSLADSYHVVAPDLPGFGHSDRPPLMYSARLYVTFVRDFLAQYDDPTVVASSLTGAYASVAVSEAALDVRELVLVCPTATTIPGQRTWLRALLRTPLVGEGLYNALTSKRAIRYFLKDHGFADARRITEEWVAYDYATSHQEGARYAPASFVSGYLDLPDTDLRGVLADLDIPIRIVWGGAAHLPPVETGRELADSCGGGFVVIEDADLLPHAEFPGQFVTLLTETRVTA
ncbi:alpha/beta fold hydrolase [Natronomonas sp. EA1]|uniref:alpha/beta fold hydrolase n=1 Tax=Natronomonas sp. EA1 TaxID=3421655 RepID=UPI003EB8C049